MNADSGLPQITNFTTSDGVMIEAEYLLPSRIKAIAVISHPHPLYGGEMRNNVVQALFSSLPADDIGTLRYNFRGVGNSQGSHGEGMLEVFDSEAAFVFAGELSESAPVFSVGYSFGADVSLTADGPGVAGWVGIASPLALLDPTQMKAGLDERPTMLLVPENDQFRALADAKDICEPWIATSMKEIAGADHFFMGFTQSVADHTTSFITEVVGQ
ncbi:MAG: hypothetical protein QGH80_00075 [Acidimicrobiales bacterium]|nr:hypothetical protein [Acidimicrobiales bacterium]